MKGGVDYKADRLTYTMAGTKSGAEFLAFLVVMVARYVCRKIPLVCDNGRFHAAKTLRQSLAGHCNQIGDFRLPPYSSLNFIQRLWRHIKRTMLAKMLFASLDNLLAAFLRGVRYVKGDVIRITS